MVWFPLWTGNWEQSSHRWPAWGWHHFLSDWSGCDGRLSVLPVGRWEWRKWWVPWTVDVPLAHVEALYNNSKQSHITLFFTNSEKQIRDVNQDIGLYMPMVLQENVFVINNGHELPIHHIYIDELALSLMQWNIYDSDKLFLSSKFKI